MVESLELENCLQCKSLTNKPDQAIARTSESVLNKWENGPNPRNNKAAKLIPVTKPICLPIKMK